MRLCVVEYVSDTNVRTHKKYIYFSKQKKKCSCIFNVQEFALRGFRDEQCGTSPIVSNFRINNINLRRRQYEKCLLLSNTKKKKFTILD